MAVAQRTNPTSPGRRHQVVQTDLRLLSKEAPERSLLESQSKTGGRNSNGRITVRFRGGGNKRRYRKIDFRRDRPGIPAKVATIEYDPNRSARIAKLHYADGMKSYILAPDGLKTGDTVISSKDADIKPGNSLRLKDIPLGTIVHAIELKIGKGAQLVRSAGVSAQLMAKDGDYAQVRLPSGEVRKIHLKCRATVGQVSNQHHARKCLGKAGRKRWLGRRPHNRGVTMNPVDHPMGGGEGRTAGGRHPCSPWGQPAKGGKTRKKKASGFIIKKRGKR